MRRACVRVSRVAIRRVAATGRQLQDWLPRSWRTAARGILTRIDGLRPGMGVEDWSRPLIQEVPEERPVSDVLAGMPIVQARDSAMHVCQRSSGPRCLLATSRLDVGGLDEVVGFLARRLPDRGMPTAVLHAVPGGQPHRLGQGRLARLLRQQGVEVFQVEEGTGPDCIRRWSPDVISGHGAPPWVAAAAERAGIPFVDNLHGVCNVFGADLKWHADSGSGLAAVIAVSSLVRDSYLAHDPRLPADRVALIPNGVHAERRLGADRAESRKRLGLSDEYVFLSLARHSLQKNTFGLLSAFGQLASRRPEAHLVIAGRPDDTRYFRRVRQLRDGMPWADRIHLRDHAMFPAALLSAADGFVLDSFFEGWSLASMEALCAGLPVVLSDVGGAREQVGNETARGYVVANPLGNPLAVTWDAVGAARFRPQVNRAEFAAAMEKLVDGREHYDGNRAQLAAESRARFSADLCVDQHAAVLTAVASGGPLPTSVLPRKAVQL